LPAAEITKHRKKGFIDEFALMCEQRDSFPLHFKVFQQCSSHLPHEGNCESDFSLGGRISDPNMRASQLANFTYITANRGWYEPTAEEIYDEYCRLFRKKDQPDVQPDGTDAQPSEVK